MEDHPVKGSHNGLDEHLETHTGVNAMEMQPPTAGMVPMSVSPEQIRFILELRRKLAQTHVSNGHGRPMRNESTAGAFAYCFFWVTCTCEEWDHIIADYPEEFLGDYQERMQERAQFGGEH
ncbi:hypothetical protein E4U22_005156 [Claviceps purpurea]|nr:hypothetical protein E4U50_001577 [Claviceps purpurea]KAG6221002.1 hypothetical protein E4U26_006236 [Claviceps purpurea]KAG6318711.1 hypothetical protein E4U22_005156 [Claviceps purpurea]